MDDAAREAVQVQVHEGQTHHVRRDVVAVEVLREAALLVGRKRAVALGVGVGVEDVLVGGDQEARRAAGWVEHVLSSSGRRLRR